MNLIGVYFQIRDDYMNLQSTEYSLHKGFAEDLTEGKFSFPIIHGIHADESNRTILGELLSDPLARFRSWFLSLWDVLQQHSTDADLKLHVIKYLRDQTKSLQYTLAVMKNLERQARDEIKRLGGNTKLEAIIDTLVVHDHEPEKARL